MRKEIKTKFNKTAKNVNPIAEEGKPLYCAHLTFLPASHISFYISRRGKEKTICLTAEYGHLLNTDEETRQKNVLP